MEIKRFCKHCKRAEVYTPREKLIKNIKSIFSSFLLIMGMSFLLYIWFIGFTPVMLSIANGHYTYISIKEADSVREDTIKIIKDCAPENELCYTYALFNAFKNVTYIPDQLGGGKHYPPSYVRTWGDDCEGLAQMFVSYAQSIGMDSKVECNENHCWAVVFIDADKYKIDLTTPELYKIIEDDCDAKECLEVIAK